MAERNLIPPRTLQGFRDYLPEAMIPRERLIETARRVYRSYGFSPIDTPALEYLEILAGKGGEETDKQIYRFQDQGERWVGLRFDLTVPLARFAAQHINELGAPFKRYHIATVWRGERRSAAVIASSCSATSTRSAPLDGGRHRNGPGDPRFAPGDRLRDFTIRLNNRKVLTGLLERQGLAERSGSCCGPSTSWGRSGRTRSPKRWWPWRARRRNRPGEVLKLAEIRGTQRGNASAGRAAGGRELDGRDGRGKLHEMLAALAAVGVTEPCVKLDVSIARGLDYYTGTIFETFLNALPGDRQHLLRRPVRQPGRALHEPGAAGHRGLAGSGSPAGGDGEAWAGGKGRHAGPGLHSLFRRGPPARLPAFGGRVAGGGHRRGGLSRGQRSSASS